MASITATASRLCPYLPTDNLDGYDSEDSLLHLSAQYTREKLRSIVRRETRQDPRQALVVISVFRSETNRRRCSLMLPGRNPVVRLSRHARKPSTRLLHSGRAPFLFMSLPSPAANELVARYYSMPLVMTQSHVAIHASHLPTAPTLVPTIESSNPMGPRMPSCGRFSMLLRSPSGAVEDDRRANLVASTRIPVSPVGRYDDDNHKSSTGYGGLSSK